MIQKRRRNGGCEREETDLGAVSDDARWDGIRGTSQELV